MLSRLATAEPRFWVVVLFGLCLIVSTGPAYTIPLSALPGTLAWKRVVAADLAFLLLVALCLLPSRPALALTARRSAWVAAAGLLGAIALTVVLSPRPSAGLPHLGRLVYSLLLFCLVASMRLALPHLRVFAAAHTVATLVLCLLTLLAYGQYRIGGVASSLLWINTEPGWSLGSSARALGGFAHPTTFVVFLYSALYYLIVLFKLAGDRRWVRWLAWTTGGAMAVVLPLTYSRAIFAPVVALFILSLIPRPTTKLAIVRTVVLGQLTAVALVLLVVSHVWNVFPISTRFDPDTKFLTIQLYAAKEERFHLYSAELRMFRDSPLLGVGPGLFAENLKRYVTLEDYWNALKFFYTHHEHLIARWLTGPDPHSSWFGWLARCGLVGIGALAGLFGWVLTRLVRRARGQGPPAEVARLAAAFMVGFLLLGFIVEIIHLKLLWLFMGLTMATTASDEA